MKKLFVFLASLFVAMGASAQKPVNNITVTNHYFNYKIRLMPASPQNPLFFNYGVWVETAPGMDIAYDLDHVLKKLEISGQRKVYLLSDEDYLMTLKVPTIMFTGHSVQTDSDGKFYASIAYMCNSPRVEVSRGEKLVIDQNVFLSGLNSEWHTVSFNTYKEASDFWRRNMGAIKSDILQDVLDRAIEAANNMVSKVLGFYITDNGELFGHMKWMNTKKHPENFTLRSNVETLATKLKTLDGTTPLTEDDLAEELAYLKALPERFTTASKADAKLRYIAYYDLCKTYLALDMPEMVTVYADLLIANGQSPKDGEKFKASARELSAILSKSFFGTRQFDPEL